MRDTTSELSGFKGGEKELLDHLESCKRWALEARLPFERRALQSLYFWAGDHWTAVEHDLTRRVGRRIEPPPFCKTARVTDNQLPIYVRQVISMCTDALSDYEVIPASGSPEDRAAARLATRLLRMRERVDNEPALREEELLWLFGCGEVLRRTQFDAKKRTEDGLTGDIVTEVVPIFKYAKCPDDTNWPPRWVVEMDARHVDWVRERYGKAVEPEDTADVMANLDSLANNIVIQKAPVRRPQSQSVVVKRLYHAPTRKYPNGRVWVWANGVLLDEHDLQIDGVLPFSRAFWYQIPGRLYAMAYLEPLLSDQKQLDVLLSQLQEVKNRQLRGDIAVAGVGDVTQRIIDPETGQREINLGPGITRFEFLRYDLNLGVAQQDYERLMRNLHDKAGLSHPTLGQVTPRKTTATELQLLREAGFQNIAYHLRNFDHHQCEVARQKLQLAQEYFTAARVMVDYNPSYNGAAPRSNEPEYFFGADLRGWRDVIPVPTPRMTPAMRRQAVAEAAQAGLFGPWLGPDGLPDPRIEYAARTQLRMMGLTEEEERLGHTFLSYEELEELVAEIHRTGVQAWLELRRRQLEQMRLGVPPPAGAPTSAPPAGAPAPALPAGLAEGEAPAPAVSGLAPGAEEMMESMSGRQETPTDYLLTV